MEASTFSSPFASVLRNPFRRSAPGKRPPAAPPTAPAPASAPPAKGRATTAEAAELAALVTDCQAGKAAAQEALYRRCYPLAMSIALHYAGNRPEAEEITQDAFFKLFRRLLRQPVLEGSVKAYLSRTVVNTAIDLIRRRKDVHFTEELDAATQAEGSDRNAGLDRLQREEIYRLLQYLPPSYRLVFNLHVLEGYGHEEVARRLGISPGTSRSNLFKARAKLRTLATTYYTLDNTPTHE